MAGIGLVPELHREFHSTPDLAGAVAASGATVPRAHRSQEELRPPLPPPNHPPPPPPPPSALVKVDLKEPTNGRDDQHSNVTGSNGKFLKYIHIYLFVLLSTERLCNSNYNDSIEICC